MGASMNKADHTLDILNDSKYDMLDPIVENIHNKCVKMDVKEKKAIMERFGRVLHHFIRTMREVDKTFNSIFNQIGYTGSYYDGIRVGEATEFDLNLILKPKLKMKPCKLGCEPGFIQIIVENTSKLEKPYKNWVVGKYLSPDGVKYWIQGVIRRAFEKMTYWYDDCEISLGRSSGPAWTLTIISSKYPLKTIYVDLVPVFEFPSDLWPIKGHRSMNKSWFVVPKSPRGNHDCLWRLSFPFQEHNMIWGLEYLKYTLRLMKRIRDQLQFHLIASYYIKTLFLWEVYIRDKHIWANNRRGRLLVYMMHRLYEALHVMNIPFFWEEECNLIGHVHPNFLANCMGRLGRFLKNIEEYINQKDPQGLKIYLDSVLGEFEEEEEELKCQSGSLCIIL